MLPQPSNDAVKRAFDVIGATVLLVLSSPLWLLAALAIKLESPGPVFFRQRRIGRSGVPFRMLKFRKMPEDLPTQGPMLTRRSDPRLTRAGALLERTKLDELPQLVNVLRGEMSLIGPRPEVEKFVDMNDPRWQIVLSARPGLFGISQIEGRNEADMYPEGCEDIEAFYREHILPDKLDRDGQYVRDAGLVYDLKLLIKGILVSVFGTVTGSSVHAHAPQMAMLGVDMMASFASLAFSLFLHNGDFLAAAKAPSFWKLAGLAALARGAVFVGMGVYRRQPQTLTNTDLIRIIKSVLYGSTLFMALAWMFGKEMPSSVLLIDALALSAILIAKAYAIAQLLRSRAKPEVRWTTNAALAAVAGGTLASAAVFVGAMRVIEPDELVVTPWLHLTWLMAAYLLVRGYGMYRYGLLRPVPGALGAVKDLPRILGGTAVGSLLIYLSDAVFYSSVVTLPVLAIDLAVSLLGVTLIRRRLWERSDGAAATGSNGAAAAPRMLLVGTGPEAEFYLSYLETVTGVRPPVLGVLDSRNDQPRAQTISGVRVLGSFAQLRAIVEAQGPDRVIYFPGEVDDRQKKEMRAICSTLGTELSAFPDLAALAGNGHATNGKHSNGRGNGDGGAR